MAKEVGVCDRPGLEVSTAVTISLVTFKTYIVKRRESKFVLLKFTKLNYKSQKFEHPSISN